MSSSLAILSQLTKTSVFVNAFRLQKFTHITTILQRDQNYLDRFGVISISF